MGNSDKCDLELAITAGIKELHHILQSLGLKSRIRRVVEGPQVHCLYKNGAWELPSLSLLFSFFGDFVFDA